MKPCSWGIQVDLAPLSALEIYVVVCGNLIQIYVSIVVFLPVNFIFPTLMFLFIMSTVHCTKFD